MTVEVAQWVHVVRTMTMSVTSAQWVPLCQAHSWPLSHLVLANHGHSAELSNFSVAMHVAHMTHEPLHIQDC
jgi:hypothetical protein